MKLIKNSMVCGLDLSGQDFSHQDLTGIVFQDCTVEGANFSAATLTGAQFTGTLVRDCNFSGAKMAGVHFEMCIGERCDFRGADLKNAKLERSCFEDGDLRMADIRGATWDNVSIAHTKINPIITDGVYLNHLKADPYSCSYTSEHLQIGCQMHSIRKWFSMAEDEIEALGPNALVEWKKWKVFLSTKILGQPCRPMRNTYADQSV